MPPKVKKGKKGKKRRKPKKVKKTKSDYENDLVELNRQLAFLISQTAEVERENNKLQDQLDKTQEEFDDIKGCLNYEIQCEEDEIAELNRDIESLEKKKNKQAKIYNEIIDELVEKRDKELAKQEEDIYNVETSLKILKHFKTQYEEYLEKEEEMSRNEEEQIITYNDIIYNENRKLLLVESVVKEEMKKQLEELSYPLKYALSPDGMKERIILVKISNNKLRDLLMISNEKYKTILPIYKKIYNEVIDGELNVKLTEDRLNMVKKGKICRFSMNVVKEVGERRFSKMWSIADTESFEFRNIKAMPKVTEEEPPTIIKLFNNIEEMALTAIDLSIDDNIDDSTSTESDSVISMNVDHLYEKRKLLIENINAIISDYFENIKPKGRIKKMKGKTRKSGFTSKAPRVLQREFFYKTLGQSKQREIETIKKKAGMLLETPSKCCLSK